MKKLLLLLLCLVGTMAGFAQNVSISGKIIDRDSKEAVSQVTLQLLKQRDSSFVGGAVSADDGSFTVKAPTKGKYLLKMSSIGYVTLFKLIDATAADSVSVGTVTLGADALMLKSATITAQAAKVVAKEDTLIYNSSAYRTPEGSTIEELVKRLPGAKIDDDGKITINGKEVKKIMVDGKEFMTGDTKTALKNLPTSIVDKVKAYDQKSDLSRVTGIDDGDEQTVLDFNIKKGMNKGVLSNIDLGAGTHSRYADRAMGGYFTDKTRLMGFVNANNVNDRGFGGRGGSFGRGRQGLQAFKMGALNFNYEKKNKLQVDGSVRWNHNDGDANTKTSSQNFVSTLGSYSNSINHNFTRSNSWNAQGRLEWQPDTMTNIMFRPTFSYSTSDGKTVSQSASYNDDPYQYVTDPLSDDGIARLSADSMMVNSRYNRSISYSDSKSYGAMLQWNRKLNTKGRNVTVRFDSRYTDSNSKNISLNNVHLYRITNKEGNDSTYQTNRYNLTPTKSYSYSAQATYSEPLWKATFLQFSYKFTYSYRKSTRSTYNFSNLGDDFFDGVSPVYRGWDSYLSRLQQPLEDYYDEDLSKYAQYKNYTHNINVMFRMIRTKFNLSAGVLLQPQSSDFTQDYLGVHTDTVRHVLNISPTLDFRYRFSQQHQLRLTYRGTTDQPSITQLLDVRDDSDPLNVSTGNPGLKPSFTQSIHGDYRNFIQNHLMFINAYFDLNTTRNSISNMVTYNEQTGGRFSRPENINGNWSISGGATYNTSIDSAGYWNINSSTYYSYSNNVGYLNLNKSATAQKNTTRNTTIAERLATSYRNDWLEVELDGNVSYNHARNNLQTANNLDTWQFAYGVNVNLTAPWGTSLSTDLHESSRRGYSDKSLNTNELVWNAQISQSFLKGKSLIVSLQLYDILHNQSNLSRSITAYQRSDTEYNSINSYALLHVIYRFNMFGGKQARRDMRKGGPDDDHGPGGMPPGGNRRGGFGGGRPMGAPMRPMM